MLSSVLVLAKTPSMIIERPNCKAEPCAWIKSSASLDEVAEGMAYLKANNLLAKTSPQFKSNGREAPLLQLWSLPEIIENNNCYNFGTGIITGTFAQPGRATSKPLGDVVTCARYVAGLISDGLVLVNKTEVGNYKGARKSCRYTALVLDPGLDYHLLRLMKPGYDPVSEAVWWHKPGGTPVMNFDFSLRKIPQNRLEDADLVPYTQFCGYFRHCVQIL